MERLIGGGDVEASASTKGKTQFCDFAITVQKGHGECGDSAFIRYDKKRFIVGVFDGVSGDPGAAMASTDAANAVLSRLKLPGRPSEQDVEDALSAAHAAVRLGATTASLLILEPDGSFIIAVIGDSPVFSIDSRGSVSLEMPMARIVSDGDSILKFFNFRNYVSSVLGSVFSQDSGLQVHIRSGRLKPGHVIILASDGLSDNLFVEVDDGYVTDASGEADLKSIVGKLREPGAVVKTIMRMLRGRIAKGRQETKKAIIVPKADDITVAVVRFTGAPKPNLKG